MSSMKDLVTCPASSSLPHGGDQLVKEEEDERTVSTTNSFAAEASLDRRAQVRLEPLASASSPASGESSGTNDQTSMWSKFTGCTGDDTLSLTHAFKVVMEEVECICGGQRRKSCIRNCAKLPCVCCPNGDDSTISSINKDDTFKSSTHSTSIKDGSNVSSSNQDGSSVSASIKDDSTEMPSGSSDKPKNDAHEETSGEEEKPVTKSSDNKATSIFFWLASSRDVIPATSSRQNSASQATDIKSTTSIKGMEESAKANLNGAQEIKLSSGTGSTTAGTTTSEALEGEDTSAALRHLSVPTILDQVTHSLDISSMFQLDDERIDKPAEAREPETEVARESEMENGNIEPEAFDKPASLSQNAAIKTENAASMKCSSSKETKQTLVEGETGSVTVSTTFSTKSFLPDPKKESLISKMKMTENDPNPVEDSEIEETVPPESATDDATSIESSVTETVPTSPMNAVPSTGLPQSGLKASSTRRSRKEKLKKALRKLGKHKHRE